MAAVPCPRRTTHQRTQRSPLWDFSLSLLALGLVGSTGCVSECERDGRTPQVYRDGLTSSDGSFYQTAPLDGTYLFFPPGRVYNLEHGLGEVPAEYHVWLAFVPDPLANGERGAGTSESAGNQAVVELVDDEILQVRNDTCAEFFVRVVARTGSASATDLVEETATSDSDAGSDVGDSDAGEPDTGAVDAGD